MHQRLIYRLSLLFLVLGSLTQSANAQLFVGCDAVQQIPREECLALVALYNNTNGPRWSINDGWLRLNNPCEWFGVECNSKPWPRNVTEIAFVNNNLRGNLPAEIALLSELSTLIIQTRRFSGDKIPLGGTLPQELGQLTKLKVLILSNNEIRGNLPKQYSTLQNLEVLDLSDNQLDDFIPDSYGDLTSLKKLVLSRNQLRGNIPESLGRLIKLDELDLSSNRLNGVIPDSLGNLIGLRSLNLQKNQLSGLIPSSLEKLTFLIWLSLAENNFSGPLPFNIANFAQDLSFCSFEDNPSSFCIPDRTAFRQISDGSICGVPLESSCSFCNLSAVVDKAACSALESFYFGTSGYDWNNQSEWLVNQDPCKWFGITCNNEQVTQIELPGNNLSGSIPEGLGQLGQLDTLDLSFNQLRGAVPFSIAQIGSNASFCSLAQNDTGLCMPGKSQYSALGLPSICQLPLDESCEPESPLRVRSFDSEVIGNTIRIYWTVDDHSSGLMFEVERKKGDGYVTVATQTIQEPNNNEIIYEFRFANVEDGLYIYRLKQISPDGSTFYSNEIEVFVGASSDLVIESLFPNPSSSSTTLRFTLNVSQRINITLFNALGQPVRTLLFSRLSEGSESIDIHLKDLPVGMYFLNIQGEHFSNITHPLLFVR